MKTFLIGPVRGKAGDFLEGQVKTLVANGFSVYWPARDTDQNDDTGFRICSDNLGAIKSADCVHIYWDGQSQGSLFDLGMAFALGKPVHVVHLPECTGGKSFQAMVKHWESA